MSRRVLIVTGAYAPAMLADMHRARHLAWELPKFGWRVEILAPDTSYQPPSCIDQDSKEFFAANIPVHYVAEPRLSPGTILRVKGIGWRALIPMLHTGARLLSTMRFDLVFISTSQFPLFLLGPIWLKRLGIPFVLDFHDPGFQEGKQRPVWARPSLKHRISFWLNKQIEARSTTTAAGLIAVSPHYIETLRRRYSLDHPSWFRAGRCDAIPFSVRPQDLEEATGLRSSKPAQQESPAKIIYVGVGGPVMFRSFALLCRTLSRLSERRRNLVGAIRIVLYGTALGWQKGHPCQLAELATSCGVAEFVDEQPARVTYRRSLEHLLDAHGALVLGVDDAGYMPSKMFTYALSGKPLFACLHRKSPAYLEFKNTPGLGHAIWFEGSDAMPVDQADILLETFLEEVIKHQFFDRRASIEPYLSSTMARRHAMLFNACLKSDRR